MSVKLNVTFPSESGIQNLNLTTDWAAGTGTLRALLEAFVNQRELVFGLYYTGGAPPVYIGYVADAFMGLTSQYLGNSQYTWYSSINNQPPTQQGVDITYVNDGDTVNFTYGPY